MPNDPKLYKMVIRYIVIFHSKIHPKNDFWFENKPSGNPGINKYAEHLIGSSTTWSHDLHLFSLKMQRNFFYNLAKLEEPFKKFR
jgi:hypothetical protein